METEGKSNGGMFVKEGEDGRQEGEGIVKKQDFTRWMNALDCPNPLASPSLALAFMLMEGNKTKEGGDDRQDVKKQHVAMGMDVLDCPFCSTPLRPPIFQCSMGHLVCSACRDKLPKKACRMCSRAVLNRCHGMERVVGSIVVPCSYAMHGCADMIAYHQKGVHEEACLHASCFCPEEGCGFVGTTEALLDHFTATHEWPTTRFQYYVPFQVPVKASVHVLGGSEDGHLFLLRVASLDNSLLHGVSLVRVEPHARKSKSGCSVGFLWFKGHYQASTLDAIRSTSLSDGLPTDYFLTVPEACRRGGTHVVLTVTIDTELVYGDEDELEEDDDDESYNEEEDDEDGSDEDEEDGDDDEEDDENGDEEEDDEDSWEEVSDDNDH